MSGPSNIPGQPFIVTCHGWSASNWLAYALNRHPQIACGHSAAAILATDRGIFDGDGIKAQLPRLRAGYLQRQGRSIAEVYGDLARAKPAPHIGTVHTYRLRDLPVQAVNFPTGPQNFRTVNLVRHPLDLVVSGYGQFRSLFRIDLNELSWTLAKVVDQGLDIVDAICDRHGLVPGDHDTICFFGACVVLGSLRQDIDAQARIGGKTDAPWGFQGSARMEDITHDPVAMSGLLQRLTGRDDLADPAYLNVVFSQNKVNIHNAQAPTGTIQRWRGLTDWQRQAFAAFFDRFDLRVAYEAMGYDFGFLEDRHG